MAKRFFTDEGLSALVDNVKAYTDGAISSVEASIPDSLSDLSSDATHRTVTDTEKSAWNAKSNFSGNYNDLTNKPSIPSIEGLATITYVDQADANKVDKVSGKGLSTNDYTTADKNKLSNIEAGAQVNTVTGVKGNSESTYRTGNINITKANIGLGNVDNTADSAKSVKHATSADSATSATKDASGNTITSTYETKTASDEKLASAKSYTDEKIGLLMNNSSEAVDSIMELAAAMEEHVDVMDALEEAIGKKADKDHSHTITANDADDDVVVLAGESGTNSVKYTASHAKKGPSAGYTSGNDKTSIGGSGASGTIKIPQITVDAYGHVTAAADESVTITMPTLPTIDDTLSDSSTNPVQNKVVKAAVDGKAKTSHASSATTYGVGTTSNYGHVKISNGDVDSVATANGLAAGMDHIHSSYVNQNAFSNVKIGSTTVAADSATDTIELVGSNVTLTPDATNDKVTIGITKDNVVAALGYTPPTSDTNTNYYHQTGSWNGLTYTASAQGGAPELKLTIPTGTSSTTVAIGNHTHTVDSSLSATSTNPVQNKAVKAALDGKAASSHNQASNTINAMTGYSKPSSTSAISTGDSLNAAIGKLEKALDGKGTSNLQIGTTSSTAAAGNHTHSGYAPAYTCGTTDLTEGSSTLATGTLYFYY